MKWLVFISLILLFKIGFTQTVIEMSSPEDAKIILLEVQDSSQSDIFIYKTNKLRDANEWDCMWKFKKWGFSNFEIFIAKDKQELFISAEESITEESKEFIPNGKVYFVKDKAYRGYRKDFSLDGMMKVTQTRTIKVRKNDLE